MCQTREGGEVNSKKRVASDRGDSGSNWSKLQEDGTWYIFYDWGKEINYFVWQS